MPQDRSHGRVPSSGIPYPSEIPYPRDTLLPSWIPYPPATKIWWWSLETCSNFFTWGPTPSCTPVLTSSGGHRSGRYASYWNAVLLELTSHVNIASQISWKTYTCSLSVKIFKLALFHKKVRKILRPQLQSETVLFCNFFRLKYSLTWKWGD